MHWGGDFSLSFYILLAGLRIILTWDRVTGKKKSNKNFITCVHGRYLCILPWGSFPMVKTFTLNVIFKKRGCLGNGLGLQRGESQFTATWKAKFGNQEFAGLCRDNRTCLGVWPLVVTIVQSLSHVWLCDLMDCSTQGFSVHHYLPEFAQTPAYWVSEAIQPSHPLSPPSPLALNFSQYHGLCQWVSSSYQLDKYWSFSFILSPSNECSGLISFKSDWFDLLPVQGTFKSLLQHHNWKASILQHVAFFTVQLSYLYMTTGIQYLWLYGTLMG